MSQENDKTLDDLEQIKNRATENLAGLDEMKKAATNFEEDIEALRQHQQCFLDGVESIASKMRGESSSPAKEKPDA